MLLGSDGQLDPASRLYCVCARYFFFATLFTFLARGNALGLF